MSETIYKYKVKPIEFVEGLELPKGAMPLFVGYENEELVSNVIMWVKVDPDSVEMEMRYFYYVGTGHKLPNGPKTYIGTVKDDLKFVWHVFEAHGKK